MGDRDELRFERRRGMLHNPVARGAHDGADVERVLEEGLEQDEIVARRDHGIDARRRPRYPTQSVQQIGLTEHDTRSSAAILRDYGNVSSPCVYFVLQAALNEQAPGGPLVDVFIRSGLQAVAGPA